MKIYSRYLVASNYARRKCYQKWAGRPKARGGRFRDCRWPTLDSRRFLKSTDDTSASRSATRRHFQNGEAKRTISNLMSDGAISYHQRALWLFGLIFARISKITANISSAQACLKTRRQAPRRAPHAAAVLDGRTFLLLPILPCQF